MLVSVIVKLNLDRRGGPVATLSQDENFVFNNLGSRIRLC
jgi:hypothetical protein